MESLKCASLVLHIRIYRFKLLLKFQEHYSINPNPFQQVLDMFLKQQKSIKYVKKAISSLKTVE